MTTESSSNPLRRPTGNSVDNPRMVVVIGATVTRVRCGRDQLSGDNQCWTRLIEFG